MRKFVFATIASAISLNVFAQSAPDSPHIYIQGQATVTAIPDNVKLTVGIVEVDKDLIAAKNKADTTMAKAIKLAKSQGVDEKGIYASNISIDRQTEYNRETGKQNFVGYRVTRSLSLTLEDLKKYPILLQQLVDSGINEINQTQFVSSRYDELHKQAQKLAIKDAKAAAKELASDYGVELKGLYTASNSPLKTDVQPYMRAEKMMVAADASGNYVPDAYQSGEITITASSYVVYLIEN
ncbi:SIMPL domain-containing protein [Pseudoalteromonas arabiensis]|uniref:SIMPL domain-containing protein n=1 Tax=Pseudoalteromonas arabiensis TaxID=874454 RepID=UPI000785AE42|nr:SIMPL domain-containing protein [Pseudoalteromonas arabiensis]